MRLVVSASLPLENETPLSFPHLKENGLNGMLMGPRKLENNPTLLAYIESNLRCGTTKLRRNSSAKKGSNNRR